MTNKYKKLLICLDNAQTDHNVLAYAQMIAKTVGSHWIHLLHVTSFNPHVNADSHLSNQEVLHDHLAAKKKEFDTAAQTYFSDMGPLQYQVHVMQGSPLWHPLRFAKDNDIDLILMGRQYGCAEEKGDPALLPCRVTRKATCSVLTVPENFKPQLTKILVPVRNSACSVIALQSAMDLAERFDANIQAVNMFQIYIPIAVRTHPDAMPDNAEELAEQEANAECASLLEKIDQSTNRLTLQCRLDKYHAPAELTEKIAKQINANLVIIGARGRTGAAGVLLGTVTEQLIKRSTIPVLATKRKGECLGILKAMLSLFE